MPARYTLRLSRLIDSLRRLPGVGPKSAQRMAFYLLDRDRQGAEALRVALADALSGIEHCPRCRMYREDEQCVYCSEKRSESGQICIVESPADLIAIENNTLYRGRYFVLMGRLSPIEGIGPEQIGLPLLQHELSSGWVKELIIAINPNVEAEATAYYLSEVGKAAGVEVSRIAHGVPMGGELEYVDSGTLAHALSGRRPV